MIEMVNYQLGKIYKIKDLDSNECYIGSTCEPTLAQRLAKHVANHTAYTKGTGSYCTSYSIIGREDYDIVLIENYPCNNKDELHARESHHTQTMNCVNKIKNQGIINEIGQPEYQKEYRKENKNCLKEYQKQYHFQHKEKRQEYNKLYHEAKKDSLKQQQNAKCLCCCVTEYQSNKLYSFACLSTLVLCYDMCF
jgi:hypothetical protein